MLNKIQKNVEFVIFVLFLRISNKIKEYLQEKEHSLEEICTLLPNTNEQEIINILNFLFDNDKVGKYGNKYQWKG